VISILDARPPLQAKNMDELLSQLILAARSEDLEGWMNILIVVIIAVFWAVAGILKARGKKPEQEEEQLAGEPTDRRPQDAKGLLKEMLQQPRRTRPMSPEPSRQYRRQVEQLRRKISYPQPTTQKKPMLLPTLESFEESKLPSLKPEAELGIEELPEFVSKPFKVLKDTGIPEESLVAEIAIEPLLDYEEPVELRRAILHYEILGRPLSLRGPSEQVIGF